jgi:uncharacterized protein YaeQ
MALGATMYTLTVDVADVDRGVYEVLELRVARHPSESIEYLVTRVLAYCLEYREGIAFTDGVSAIDEPAVVVRDLTGRLTGWIEVGAPDPERVHRGSKLAGRVAIYTHREPSIVLGQLDGTRIHRAGEIPLYSFGRGFIASVAPKVERRTKVAISVTERQLYLTLAGETFATAVEMRRLGET